MVDYATFASVHLIFTFLDPMYHGEICSETRESVIGAAENVRGGAMAYNARKAAQTIAFFAMKNGAPPLRS